MASKDSISSSHKSAIDGPDDSRAPIQRRGGSYPGKAGTAQEGEQRRCRPQDRYLQSQPAACAADATFSKRPHHANTAKLYSELSTSCFNANIEFHIDSMRLGFRDNRLIGAPG